MNGFLCKIKNWMLLIHSATLEIRSVLGVVCDLSVITRIRSAWGQVPGTLANINLTCPFIHHPWANITARISALSCCMPVSVGPPNVNDLLKLQT